MNIPLHTYDDQTAGQPVICIGPGNGFPPQMYAPIARVLGTDFHRVCLVPRPWWDATVPESFPNWQIVADDLVAGIRQHELAPVIGMGHSMSGMAMVMAAHAHPELFRALVLVDPVILPRIAYWLYPIFRMVGRDIKADLIKGALNRRREWPSVEDAYERFRRRGVFRRVSDEVLRLYTEGITRPKADGDGIELAYPPEWEAAIYRRSPAYNVWPLVQKLTMPVCVIMGADSNTFLPPAERRMQKLRPDFLIYSIPDAGHLAPFEEPDAVAEAARGFIASLG